MYMEGDATKNISDWSQQPHVTLATQADWSLLPHVTLTQVCTYLRDTERVRFGQVCRRWNFAYHHCDLWRERSFTITGSPIHLRSMIAYARVFGFALRRLKLRLALWQRSPVSPELWHLYGQFIATLHNSDCQLSHVTLVSSAGYYCRVNIQRFSLLSNLIIFFKSQTHTTQLTLALDDLTSLGAASLLQALSLRAASALRIIRLEADKCQRERYCKIVVGALCKFPCLEQLHIGYRCLAGGGLVTLCSTCPRLKLLDCVIEESSVKAVSDRDWILARSLCPKLKVSITTRNSTVSLDDVIPANVAVQCVDMLCATPESADHLAATLSFTARCFHRTLKSVMVECWAKTPDLHESVVTLLNRCQKLTTLDLTLHSLSLACLTDIYLGLMDGTFGLTTFRVKLLRATTSDTLSNMLSLTQQYHASLHDRGINCCLRLQPSS